MPLQFKITYSCQECNFITHVFSINNNTDFPVCYCDRVTPKVQVIQWDNTKPEEGGKIIFSLNDNNIQQNSRGKND